MIQERHPIFGTIATDPNFLNPSDRALYDAERRFHADLEADYEVRQKAKMAGLMEMLDTITPEGCKPLPPVQPVIAQPKQPVIAQPAPKVEQPQEFQPATRTEDGVTYDLMPPDTMPCAGDLGDSSGVWRPRPKPSAPKAEQRPQIQTQKPCATRYDRAFTACRNAEKAFADFRQKLGPTDSATIAAASKVQKARAAFEKVKVQYRDHPDRMRQIDNAEAYRQTPEGREAYNTKRNDKRRTRDTPNRDLSDMTPEEKRVHTNAQAKERMRKSRAMKKQNTA